VKLKKYLQSHGIKYKLIAQNPNSHQLFWVYVRDEKLNELLNKWSEQY
jgi:hypothetical protein